MRRGWHGKDDGVLPICSHVARRHAQMDSHSATVTQSFQLKVTEEAKTKQRVSSSSRGGLANRRGRRASHLVSHEPLAIANSLAGHRKGDKYWYGLLHAPKPQSELSSAWYLGLFYNVNVQMGREVVCH